MVESPTKMIKKRIPNQGFTNFSTLGEKTPITHLEFKMLRAFERYKLKELVNN